MVLWGCGRSDADQAQIEEDLGETEVVLEEEADAVLREMSDFLAMVARALGCCRLHTSRSSAHDLDSRWFSSEHTHAYLSDPRNKSLAGRAIERNKA